MAAFVRVVVVLLVCWIQRSSTQSDRPSRITLSKDKIALTPNTTSTGTEISVTCQPPASGVKTVFGLTIQKLAFTSGATPKNVVLATSDTNNGVAELKVTMQGATVSGSTSSQSITLIMNQARCGNEGTYICSATYTRSDNSDFATSESRKDLTLEVGPGKVTMTASNMPFGKTTWAVNDTLTLTCEGPVGTVNISGSNPEPQITWIWQYTDSDNSPGSNSWLNYNTKSDISTGSFIADNSVSCNTYKTQTSTLQLHLTTDDTNRIYRCYVRRGGQDFDQFSDRYTVGTVTPDGSTPPPTGPPDTSSANVGGIVGGVIGALIIIAVIIIVVYFFVIRPRQQKQDEEDNDGGHDKGVDDKEPVPPYTPSADHSVVYSHPAKRGKDKTDRDETPDEKEGVSNKAMDEEPEPEKHHGDGGTTKLAAPDDNDDRRHGRRSNKDRKHKSAPYEPSDKPPLADDYDHDIRYGKGDDDRRDRRRRDDGDRRSDDNRRGPSGDRNRPPAHKDAYDERQPPARYDDDYYGGGQGRRNRGYENDSRAPRKAGGGHHSSSEDGGTDHSFVNTSQYSIGHGDPTIGTSI